MKNILTLCLSMLFSISIFASETSVQAVLCGETKEVDHWTYDRSFNSKDGVYDRQGYIKITFKTVKTKEGTLSTTRLTVPVKGLAWDHNFRTFFHSDNEGTVICAQKRWWGLKKDLDSCFLEKIGDGIQVDVDKFVCENKKATVIPFKFVVR